MREFHLRISDAIMAESSAGNLLKWSVNINGRSLFIKTSTYNNSNFQGVWMYESFSEIIVCRLLKELGLDEKSVVTYYPCKIYLDNGDITVGCYSYSFLKDNEKFISLAHLNKVGLLRNYMFEGYNGYIQCIKDVRHLVEIDYKYELDKIITIDYLTLNEDRHTGNLGFIYNYETHEYRIAPIFDNGISLFSTKFVEGMSYSTSLDTYAKSKPFYYQHEMQLSMIGKPFKLKCIEPINTYKYIRNLEKIGLNKERANFIISLIQTRISLLRLKY